MYFYGSKSTLDSLNSVFNVLRKKMSLGAPDVLESVTACWSYLFFYMGE